MAPLPRGSSGASTRPRRRWPGGCSARSGPSASGPSWRPRPRALDEAVLLADRIEFDLGHDLGYRYPGSDDEHADRKLAEVCRSLLVERYADRPGRARASERLEDELAVIRRLGLSGFFLLH